MSLRPLFIALATFLLSLSCATQAFATDNEELEKARASMKCGHCEESFKTLNKLAQRGHPAAQCLLGLCYQTGRGVSKDTHQAAQWYEKSAKQGFADAQSRLGHMYLNGNEIEKDATKAEHWLAKAAHQGVAEAQYNLGKMYIQDNNFYNKTVTKRMLQGRRLILLARDQGVEDTEKLLDRIPGYDKTASAIKDKYHGATSGFSQGVGNIETSWEGYGEMVKSMRNLDAGATQ
ncbi:MAG: sel1 repeat family protein [Cyanobacteria bacterium SZAS-4]|nr:sel1 repeat family protein [Cyanobacteria bacterium SZAS-4]